MVRVVDVASGERAMFFKAIKNGNELVRKHGFNRLTSHRSIDIGQREFGIAITLRNGKRSVDFNRAPLCGRRIVTHKILYSLVAEGGEICNPYVYLYCTYIYRILQLLRLVNSALPLYLSP